MNGMTAAAIAIALMSSTLSAQAADRPTGFPAVCAPGEVQVMLLGTYHFANPGRDVIRQNIDDVLAPARQAELEVLANRLVAWKPDLIAVEWPLSFQDSTNARYARYQAGTLAPSRNEVVQIGFRIAAKLGHPTVHGIDDDSNLDLNDSLKAIEARRSDFRKTRDSITRLMQAAADSINVWRKTTTIVQHLRELNTDEALHQGNSRGMFGGWLAEGEGSNYGGPNFLIEWYRRNMNMVHHLTRIRRADTRRILVVVGNGHVPPLRNLLDEAPQFCPVSPLPLLR
jgi:hypothetical protein